MVCPSRHDRETAIVRPGLVPINAQHAEQLRRQHDIPIPAALALFDPDQHAAAVEALGHTRVPFAGFRPDHRAGIELAAVDALLTSQQQRMDWRAGRDAVYQLAALTVGARLAVADA